MTEVIYVILIVDEIPGRTCSRFSHEARGRGDFSALVRHLYLSN